MISHISTKLSHQTIFFAFLFYFLQNHWIEILWIFFPFLLCCCLFAVCRLSELLSLFGCSSTTMDKKVWKNRENRFPSTRLFFLLLFAVVSNSLSVLFIISFQPTESRLLVEFTMQFYHIPYCSVVVSLAWALLTLWNKKQHTTSNQNIFIQNNTWNTKPDNPSQKSTEDIYRSGNKSDFHMRNRAKEEKKFKITQKVLFTAMLSLTVDFSRAHFRV